jgi:glutathione synthase
MTMNVKVAVIMDPIQSISPKKDTSLGLMEAAQRRGWSIFYCEPQHIWFADQTLAKLQPVSVSFDEQHWFDFTGDPLICPLSDMDIVLMRKDPPFDSEYIYATYLLERAQAQGTLVANHPQSLRDCNEKFFATAFSDCTPALMVGKNMQQLRDFHQQHQDVIYKPLDGMGGTSIFRAKPDDPNLGVILETLTQYGTQTIMAQKYLPEIRKGDKRILMVNGQAIPYCLARIPSQGESRGNLAAGGHGVVQALSERDQWIANQVGPELFARGIYFAGLDVIGDYLTEVNVTSPTCLREITRETGIDIAAQLMDCLESKLPLAKP